MEILRHVFFFNTIIGLLVAGGVLFNKKRLSNLFLGILILAFTLKQFAFLYETSNTFFYVYPDLFMSTFPLSCLLGPALYYHVKLLPGNEGIVDWKILLHLIPFFLLTVLTIFFFSMGPDERIIFIQDNKPNLIVPINHFKVLHIASYAAVIIYWLRSNYQVWSVLKRNYIKVVVAIFTFSALFQAIYYAGSLPFETFLIYHVIASSLIIFVGFTLYFKPEVLQKVRSKYSKSNLNEGDKKRIYKKIRDCLSNQAILINPDLNLELLCSQINEKKHHVSQTLSENNKTSFNDLINQERVEFSKHLLLDPEYDHFKIAAIGMESGFKSKNTFNRAFLKFAECTPNQFKKKYREKAPL